MSDRSQILSLMRGGGVRHPFVEDCPCGCADFFAFGRRDREVWIVFSTDLVPFRLRGVRQRVPLDRVSKELRDVLLTVEYVLAASDPIPIDPAPASMPPVRPETMPNPMGDLELLARLGVTPHANTGRNKRPAVEKPIEKPLKDKKKGGVGRDGKVRYYSPEARQRMGEATRRRWARWRAARGITE